MSAGKTRLTCLILFVFAASLPAAESDPIRRLEQRVVEHTLKNGLRVLILERPTAPLVSYEMMFRAGGVDEARGKTGLAHLFEHMLFKGSETVGTLDYAKEKPLIEAIDRAAEALAAEEDRRGGPDAAKLAALRRRLQELEAAHQKWLVPSEFEQTYQRAGAQGLNAFTGKDMTGFVVSLPANKWELWPLLESDRMAHPVLREFYKERDVVMEERRMRYEDDPDGKLWENFIAACYLAHPYGSPTIGWSSDVRRLTRADAESFFRAHYAPNNAAVAVVGDVRAKEVISKFASYFAGVPGAPPPGENATAEPEQNGERRLRIHFDAEPSLLIGFHKPNPPHPDNFALEVIEQILTRGRTARFYRGIVEKKIALSAWASNGNPGERYPNLFILGGSPRKPHTNADLEKAVWAELERLQKEKVSERELQKIRNQVEADFIRNLASNGGMAGQLAYDQAVLGDWRYLFKYLEGIRAVTPGDIQHAAQTYFLPERQTVALLERGRK